MSGTGRGVQKEREGACWPGDVRMPALAVPCACLCTWVVETAGPGMACVSRLKYRNALCTARHPRSVP